jgi:hypothetical protein
MRISASLEGMSLSLFAAWNNLGEFAMPKIFGGTGNLK